MFEDMGTNQISSEAQNAPNLSFAANPILGNVEFNIEAPNVKGMSVQPGFPQVPYISIESLIFFQNMTNPSVSTYQILPGSSTGQTVVSGQTTMQDAAGITRFSQGTISGTGTNASLGG